MNRLVKKSRLPIREIASIGMLPSRVKTAIYRRRGYRIGPNVHFGLGSVVVGDDVEIGEGTSIGFMTVVRAKRIKIGRYVKIGSTSVVDTEVLEIGDDSRINEQVFVGGTPTPSSSLKIGKRAIIMQMSFINPSMPIEIGDDSGIGGHCLLFTHGSWLSQLDGFPVSFAPITIGKNVWLPWRVFVMPGVTIGDNVVIGADSLLHRDIPSNCLAAGSPAKVLKENYPPPLDDEKRSAILDSIMGEFTEHLEYHGYRASREAEPGGYRLKVRQGDRTDELLYLSDGAESDAVRHADVVVWDSTEDLAASAARRQGMVVDLNAKTRLGSSELGEEFVSFVSRFGVRFDRLD